MEGVEALNPVVTETASPVTIEAPVQQSEDDALAAVWDKVERDNNAARDENGKFTSENKEPLEGGEGEAAETVAETSTPETVDVPLPSNWRGLEETWSKLPKELREPIRAHEEKLHQTLSQQ